MANELRFQAEGLEESRKDVNRFADALGNLKNTAKDAQQQLSKRFNANVGGSGGSSSGSAFSAQGAQQGADIAGNIGQLSTVIPQANEELVKITSSFDQASTVVSSATGALSGLNATSLATVGAIAAIALALNELNKASEKRLQATEDRIAALKEQQRIETLSLQILTNATRESIKARTTEARIAQEQAQAILDIRRDALNEEREIAQDFSDDLSFLGERASNNITKIADSIGVFNVQELEDELEGAQAALESVNAELEILNSAEVERAIATNETIEAIQREFDVRMLLARQINTLTKEQVENTIEVNEALAKLDREKAIAFFNELVDASENTDLGIVLEPLQRQLENGTLGFSELEARLAGISDATVKYGAEIDATQQILLEQFLETADSVQQLTAETEAYRDIVLPTVSAMEAQREITDKIATAVEELREEAEAAVPELTKVTQQISDIQATIDAELQANRTADTRAAIEASLEARIEEAKEAEAAAQILRNISQIRTKALQRELELVNQYRKAQQNAIDEFNDAVADLNKEFMDSEIEAYQEFYKEQSRLQEDFNTDYLRTLEDLNDNLLDAALDNDIKRFIQIQKQGEKEIQRKSEDFNKDQRRRAQDFNEERAQAREQFKQRMKDLEEQFKAERKARQEAFELELEEFQIQTESRIQAQRESGRAQISESQRLEQQLSNLRNNWRRQDEMTRRNIRIQGLLQELNDMQAHQSNLRKVVAASFNAIFNDIAKMASGATGGTSVPTVPSFSGTQVPSIPSAPTRATGGAARAVNVNIASVNVGEVVTPREMEQQMGGLMGAIQQAVESIGA